MTALLEAQGERIHPASRFLANESAHIVSESHEHDLHAFQAMRRMDEILLANFGVFEDLMTDEHYDVSSATRHGTSTTSSTRTPSSSAPRSCG